MDLFEVFSWLLVLLGLVGTWITGKHNFGWLLAVLFQVLWAYYAFVISAEALAAQSLAFALIALRNYIIGKNTEE